MNLYLPSILTNHKLKPSKLQPYSRVWKTEYFSWKRKRAFVYWSTFLKVFVAWSPTKVYNAYYWSIQPFWFSLQTSFKDNMVSILNLSLYYFTSYLELIKMLFTLKEPGRIRTCFQDFFVHTNIHFSEHYYPKRLFYRHKLVCSIMF